jgi:hypothetical protein
MIDLTTIVFRQEIPILKVQAQSVELYCQTVEIGDIFIMVNDNDNVAELIDKNWWGSFADKVRIVPRSTFPVDYHHNGWISQQVLKLLSSTLSHSKFTLVMDAKTVFIKNLDKTVLSEYGNSLIDASPVWKDFQQALGELFNINVETIMWPPGVPFLWSNAIVKLMMDAVIISSGEEFTKWFQKHKNPSEFLLYSAYAQLLQIGPTKRNHRPKHGAVNIAKHEYDQFESKFKMMQLKDPLVVMIHRVAWDNLSRENKQQYIDFLVSKNITASKELV